MSGGSDSIIRSLLDLFLYWVAALVAAFIGTPTRIPPLLFYLVFGAIYGNFNITEGGESVDFFAEWAITIVFFSLGLDETVDHFIHGVQKAWGIALIGALVPFGCGYLTAFLFFPDDGWRVHLTMATAVTATAVSLTMIVLQSVNLLRTRSAMGIMTSAVLDDVGCLVLVAILVPIVVAGGGDSAGYTPIRSIACAIPDLNGANISGSISLNTGAAVATTANTTVVIGHLTSAIKTDIMNITNAPSHLLQVSHVTLIGTVLRAEFDFYPSSSIHLTAGNVDHIMFQAQAERQGLGYFSTDATLHQLVGARVTSTRLSGPLATRSSGSSVKVLDILWIIGKVIIFFIIIIFLHTVVMPHDVTSGPISYIPGVRSYGIKHILQLFAGVQVPLIIVTFGLGLGLVGAALGFHPAVGAYFAGLLLEERYFDIDPPKMEVTARDRDLQTAPSSVKESHGADVVVDQPPADGSTQQQSSTAPQPMDSAALEAADHGAEQGSDVFEADMDFEMPPVNTIEHAKDAVGTASFMWLGPVFFVHLGAGLTIDTSLLAEGIPQALGIFAVLWVGQFFSATLAAKYVPGGYSWAESALVGFGMLGRAELYFVVLNLAKTEGVFEDRHFFPMAVAAMFMNITLPICISVFKPIFRKYHPEGEEAEGEEPDELLEGAAGAEAGRKTADGRSELGARSEAAKLLEEERVWGGISRRGIGVGGIDLAPAKGDIEFGRRSSAPGSRQGSVLVRRNASRLSQRRAVGRESYAVDDTDYFADIPQFTYTNEPVDGPGDAGPGQAPSPVRRGGGSGTLGAQAAGPSPSPGTRTPQRRVSRLRQRSPAPFGE